MTLLLEIFSIVAPVFVCALVGYLWVTRGGKLDHNVLTQMVMNIFAPFLVLSSFQQAEISPEAIAQVGLAAVTCTALVAAATLMIARASGADTRTFFPLVVFQNTGNLGIPLCLFAFGETGMTYAVVTFVWVSGLNFTVGVAIASGERNLLRAFAKPVVLATIIGLVLTLNDIVLPQWVGNTTSLLGAPTIPLMLIALGASISTLKVQALGRSLIWAGLRFSLGIAAALLVVSWFGLTGIERGVIILQFAMPPAVFNYLIAAQYNRRPEEAAGAVVVGTVLAMAVLPTVLWFLLR